MKKEIKYITPYRSTNISPADFGTNLFVLVCLIAFVVYNLLA